MRALVGLVLLLAPACALREPPSWEQAPPPVRTGPVVDASRLTRAQLENGLAVLVLEDPRLPEVQLGVTVRRGAGIVPPEQAGLATYTAELMERGAGEDDHLALAERVDALGANLSVAAGWDEVRVFVSGLSRDQEELLGILADVVLRPRFDADEVDKVRSELLAALEGAKDDPGTLGRWHLAALLYPEHAYGVPTEGTLDSVARLGARDARDFHARIFVPGNAILSASGDVDAARFVARAREVFGDWPAGPVPEPGPPPPPRTPEQRRVVIVDVPDRGQARVLFGHEGLARTDPDRVAASLMNAALGGGGFISRLMTRLRAEEGLTYGVGSGFDLRRQPGPFLVSTSTRVPEVRRVVDAVLAELERMREEPPGPIEFGNMKTLTTGRFALSLETSQAMAGALVELDVAGLPPDSLDTFRTRIRDQTVEDVARVAREHLHPERIAIVVAGPADALRPQLEGLGAIEVVSP